MEDTLLAENVPFEKDLAYLLFIDSLWICKELKIAKMHRTSTVEKKAREILGIWLSYRMVLEINLRLRYVNLVASIEIPTCIE